MGRGSTLPNLAFADTLGRVGSPETAKSILKSCLLGAVFRAPILFPSKGLTKYQRYVILCLTKVENDK